MRAREPDRAGFIERDGVRVGWELFDRGHPPGTPTVFLLPTWHIVHSRFWKGQIPDLARRYRVLTLDNLGNGRSDRPTDPAKLTIAATVSDCIAAMDATETEKAVIVGLSMGGAYAIRIAAVHPERVAGAVFIAPSVAGFGHEFEGREEVDFEADVDSFEGWRHETRASYLGDWRGFAEWFFRLAINEPHSTKQIEDSVTWAGETTPEIILAGYAAYDLPGATMGSSHDFVARVRCPALVIVGTADEITEPSVGTELAAALGANLVLLEGSGHVPTARDPVRINLLLRAFVERVRSGERAGATAAASRG